MRLIDADTYLKKVCTYNETGCGSCKLQTMCPKDEPTIEAVPVVHGHWIPMMGHSYCSACGYKGSPVQSNYCPNCGARMDEATDYGFMYNPKMDEVSE